MSSTPWHKRYHSDALTGYSSLTLEERGAYTTLLDLMYDREGPLVDNERLLAGYMGIPLQRYKKLRGVLIDQGKIFYTGDGKLSNPRFEKELVRRDKIAKQNSENRKSSKKVDEKLPRSSSKSDQVSDNFLSTLDQTSEKKPNEINGTSKGTVKGNGDNTRYQIPDTRKKEENYVKEFDLFWEAYPRRFGGNPKKPAMIKFKKLCETVDPSEIIEGARKYAAQETENVGTKFIAQAITWLNQERWNDDYCEPIKPKAGLTERAEDFDESWGDKPEEGDLFNVV